MSSQELRLQRLHAGHDVAGCDSGNAELEGWLQRHAMAAQQLDAARTFLLMESGRIVGYFSLTMGSVRREDAPRRLVRGMPGYPVGMVLLARLAVHRGRARQGAGHTAAR